MEQKTTSKQNRRASRYESDVSLDELSKLSNAPSLPSPTDSATTIASPPAPAPLAPPTAPTTSSPITIMVGAQRRGRGSSLGTGSRGNELDGLVGLPLNVFKYQKNLSVPRENVLSNAYLTAKLRATETTPPATTTPNNVLRIKVTSPAMVDAFLIVCREVCGSICSRYEVTQSDQLHLYSAASEIGIPRLQGLCEDVIAERFTPKRFVAAVRIALRHGRDSMIRLCYFWFKTQGATDHEAFLRRLDMTSTEKAVDSAFTTDTITRSQLFFHRETREISAGGTHRFSIDVFAQTLQTEHLRKSHLFRPPVPVLNIDNAIDQKEEGDNETAKQTSTSPTTDLIVDHVVEEMAAAQELAKKIADETETMASATKAEKNEEGEEGEEKNKEGEEKGEETGQGKEKEKEKEKNDNNDNKDTAAETETATTTTTTTTTATATATTNEDENINERAEEEQPNEKDKDKDNEKLSSPSSGLKSRQPYKSHDTQVQSAFDAKGFEGLKKCHVIRERKCGDMKDQTRYIVLSEPYNEFVVAAIVKDGVVFHFSLDPDDFSLDSPDYVGTMDCSFTGTTFTLRDYGMDHEIMNTEVLNEGIPGIGFVEHCVVVYDTNILGRVPNAMMVHIPHGRMSEDALIDDDLPYHKTEAADNGLLAIVDKSGPDFSRLQTRKPIWSDDLEAWTMDFHGRVKLASKKNFLLVSENAPNEVLMLFGKVSKSHFSLDFKAPMTVMQAFCIALTSFADKMLVT